MELGGGDGSRLGGGEAVAPYTFTVQFSDSDEFLTTRPVSGLDAAPHSDGVPVHLRGHQLHQFHQSMMKAHHHILRWHLEGDHHCQQTYSGQHHHLTHLQILMGDLEGTGLFLISSRPLRRYMGWSTVVSALLLQKNQGQWRRP